jgi:hypothetical protein
MMVAVGGNFMASEVDFSDQVWKAFGEPTEYEEGSPNLDTGYSMPDTGCSMLGADC